MVLSTLIVTCMGCSASFIDTIGKAAEKYNINPNYLVAIGHVETNLNEDAPIRYNTNNTIDVGPFQINSVHRDSTCKEYNVDSLSGNTHCAAKLIRMHSRKSKTDPMWLARYHSKTPSKKKKYYKKLLKYLK